MKNLLFALLLLASVTTFAQQSEVTVPVNKAGSVKYNGYLYLPKDYNTSNQSYPVVFFYHGTGEAGTDVTKLLRQGVPYNLAHDNTPDSTINPADGKYYSFIILSLQAPTWSVSPADFPFELAWLRKNYRIDTSRIYITGLSAGGQCAFRTLTTTDSVAKKIAAAVIMSPAYYGNRDYSLISKYKIHTWFLCGLQDNVVGIKPTTVYHDSCSLAYPSSSVVSWYVGTHTGWIGRYDKKYKDPVTSLSVWQWLLLYKKEN